MLTIQFPKGTQEYALYEDQRSEIWIESNHKENGLFLYSYFKGYSFYLEDIPVSAFREIELPDEEVSVGSKNDAEFTAHEGRVDLQVTQASLTFERKEDHILAHVAGQAMLHSTEDASGEDAARVGITKNDTVLFSFSAPCQIRQGDFQLEFAYGLEYCPAPDVDSLEEIVAMAKEGLNEMADESNTKAMELVAVVDSSDESSIRIYGRGDHLIIEGTYPIDGKWRQFILAHRDVSDVSTVTFTPDSVNNPIEVETDEFFTVTEAEHILEEFLRSRFVDIQTYQAKKKQYLF